MWSKVETWFAKWPTGYRFLLPVAWMVAIYALSAQPTLPEAASPLADLLVKKAAHMLEYAVLAVLWWKAWSARRLQISPLALAWILTVLYAASDEFHQTFVCGRSGRIADVIVDTVGASLAMYVVHVVLRRRKEVART